MAIDVLTAHSSGAAVLPPEVLFMSGHHSAADPHFSREVLPHFNMIGGTSNNAAFLNQVRADGKIYSQHVWNDPNATSSQQLLNLWRTPFNDTLGGSFPGGFDAVHIDELHPWPNGSAGSNRVVSALQQLRQDYPDKIISVWTRWQLLDNPNHYSDQLNAINQYADLHLAEVYVREGNPQFHLFGSYANKLNAAIPGLLDKTIYGLYIPQGAFVADDSTDIGFWGFLDEQMHNIRNGGATAQMPGIAYWVYYQSEHVTTEQVGRLVDHYYVDDRTDYFGDGDYDQLIGNAQFEGSTSGWSIHAATGGSVAPSSYSGTGLDTFHDDFGQASHGSFGLRMARGNGASTAIFSAQVDPDMAHTVSAFVIADSGNSDNAMVEIRSISGELLASKKASQAIVPVGAGPWRRILFNFDPQGHDDVQVILTDASVPSGTVLYWDFVELEEAYATMPIGPVSGQWSVDADGNWSDSSNWVPSRAPAGVGSSAVLGDVISTARRVMFDQDVVIGSLTLDSPYGYTVFDAKGFHEMTLEAASGTVKIDVIQGDHVLDAKVTIAGDLSVNVFTGSLELSAVQPLNLGGQTLTKTGYGALRLGGITGGGNVVVQQGQLFFSGTHLGGGFYGIGVGALMVAEGLILGDVINSGIFSVGPTLGGSGLVVSGDFSQNSNGLLQLELAGIDSYDTLSVGGTLTAGGSFRALLSGSYMPEADDQFSLLSFGTTSGAFTTVDLPTLGQGLMWDASGLLTSGMLKVLSAVLLGDANNDNQVTGGDLIAVQQNFGITGSSSGLLVGDANDDGQVTGADLIAVQQNFGATLVPEVTAVPEPASQIVVLGALLFLRRRTSN